jgi:hypothetical protein
MSPTDIFDDVINAPIGATVSLGKEQYRLGPAGWMNVTAALPEYSDPRHVNIAAGDRLQSNYQDLNRRTSADVHGIASGPGSIVAQQQAIQKRQAQFLREQEEMRAAHARDAYAEQQARTRDAGIARVVNRGIDDAARQQQQQANEAHRREQAAIVAAARPPQPAAGQTLTNPDDARRASWLAQSQEQASHRKTDWETSKLGDTRVGDRGVTFRKTALGWEEEPKHDVISAMAANKQRDIDATRQRAADNEAQEVEAAFRRGGARHNPGRVLVNGKTYDRSPPRF